MGKKTAFLNGVPMTIHLNYSNIRSSYHDECEHFMLYDGGQYVNRTLEEHEQTERNIRFLRVISFVFSDSWEPGRKKVSSLLF
jgi:hypothetical protein